MKKEEMMLKATQMLAKGKFKLKKAGPTIMIVGAAIGGVTAAVLELLNFYPVSMKQ